jgi:two-component system chemotaxis sensor kinase CheA
VTELLDVRAAILAADPAFYNSPVLPAQSTSSDVSASLLEV